MKEFANYEIEISKSETDPMKTIIGIESNAIGELVTAFKKKVFSKNSRIRIVENGMSVQILCNESKLILPLSEIKYITVEPYSKN